MLPLRVWIQGDSLVAQAQATGQGKITQRYLGNDVFGAAFDPTVRLTLTIENAKASEVLLLQRGGTIGGAKQP